MPRIGEKKDYHGGISGRRVRLPDFEAAHPGIRLRRITYEETE